MKNTVVFFLSIIAFSLQSCTKEKKTKLENLSKTEIQKPEDSIKSISEEKPEKSIQYSITVEKIDSLQYHSVNKKAAPKKKNLLKIKDINEVKKRLKGIVEFDENPDFGANPAIKKINFRNGKTFENSNDWDYYFFIAYYPEEDILLCEGGHSTDISFNLKNGKETEETGNPDLINFSPKETFRINGSYDGQECSGYFIQRKMNGEYEKIINFEEEFKKISKIDLCNIRNSFWEDEHTFFLEKFDYGYASGKFKYFKVKIIEKQINFSSN